MLKYILTITGGMIFLGGYYYMQKNRESVSTMRIYALGTYAGLCMLIIGGAGFADPLFKGLSDDTVFLVRTGIQVALFVIGAELLLRPAFEDQEEKSKKNDLSRYSGGSSGKPIRKKSSKKTGKKVKNQGQYQTMKPAKPKNNPKKKKK